jgi:hypothetical protein
MCFTAWGHCELGSVRARFIRGTYSRGKGAAEDDVFTVQLASVDCEVQVELGPANGFMLRVVDGAETRSSTLFSIAWAQNAGSCVNLVRRTRCSL